MFVIFIFISTGVQNICIYIIPLFIILPLILIRGQSWHNVSMMDLMGSVSLGAVGALGLALHAGILFGVLSVCLFFKKHGAHFVFISAISIGWDYFCKSSFLCTERVLKKKKKIFSKLRFLAGLVCKQRGEKKTPNRHFLFCSESKCGAWRADMVSNAAFSECLLISYNTIFFLFLFMG